ncbi:MAG: hypothetical protein GXY36_02890 [Chloroflexi bacterium]|jgi:hypothetical protein|nr:hypothetical protein [Chloroflexota bacterium]
MRHFSFARTRLILLAVALLVALALPVVNRPIHASDSQPGAAPARAQGSNCSDGLINDDGGFENGYAGPGGASNVTFVERYTPPVVPFRVTDVCVCWLQNSGSTSINYSIVFYADDATWPGQEIARFGAAASGIPGTLPGAFSGAGVDAVVDGPFWVGVNFDSGANPGVFLCGDENGPGGSPGGAWSLDGGATWENTVNFFALYRATGIRARGEEVDTSAGPVTTAADNARAQAPLLQTMNGASSVRTTLSDGAVQDGSIFGRVIAQDGQFQLDAGQIGNQGVLDSGVIQAVDVFALNHQGQAITHFNSPVEVCLKGSGRVLYLDSNAMPRVPVELPGAERDGYTCANVPNAGVVALVSG